jgi:hypothetical protein
VQPISGVERVAEHIGTATISIELYNTSTQSP